MAYKLPALYLLDSVVKNVGQPYTDLFAKNLYNTFMAVFTVVDSGTRKKLEDLARLWTMPLPGTGSQIPVFPLAATQKITVTLAKIREMIERQQATAARPVVCIRNIQRFSNPVNQPTGPSYRSSAMSAVQRPPPSAPLVTTNSLLQDISSFIYTCQKRLAQNQYDSEASMRISALKQLSSVLMSTELSSDQLQDVKSRLRVIMSSPPAVAQPGIAASYSASAPQQSDMLNKILAGTNAPLPAPTKSTYGEPAQSQASDLLTRLQNAGILGTDLPSNIGEAFSQGVVIELNLASLEKPRPELIDQLFNSLSLQCSSCGLRFKNSAEGIRERDEHLDWHFHINKRLRDDAGRGQSRSWYPDEELFVNIWRDDEAENAGHMDHQNSGAAAEADVADAYIAVPENPEEASKPCPICQEQFSSEWNDKTDEWVWRNAVRRGGKIYHATCYLEAAKSSTDTETMGEGGGTRNSRADTKAQAPLPAAITNDQLAGIIGLLGKRKPEEFSGDVGKQETEDEGVPVKRERLISSP